MQSRYSRYHGTRQEQLTHLRARGWTILNLKSVPLVVAFTKLAGTDGMVVVKVWRGKADKPCYHHTFRSATEAENSVKYLAGNAAATLAHEATRRAEQKTRRDALKASDHWSVGDVLYNSWGYEQTNIDWYQVVEVKAKSIVIRGVMKNFGDTGWLQGKSQPRRNDFHGKPMLKPLDERGRISMRHGAATKWDGRPVSESSYH